jgi:hypothetical protein
MFKECVDPEQIIVVQEVSALQGIQFQKYTSYYNCGVTQQICTQWEETQDRNQKFERIRGGVCQYHRIIQPVVTAIIVAGPLNVVTSLPA